jgi:Cu/Ag efflux pump CusA
MERQRVIFALTGRIQAAQVPELLVLLKSESLAHGIVLDLEQVKLVDRDAVLFLALSEATGAELKNCSTYIRKWIDQERNTAKKRTRKPSGIGRIRGKHMWIIRLALRRPLHICSDDHSDPRRGNRVDRAHAHRYLPEYRYSGREHHLELQRALVPEQMADRIVSLTERNLTTVVDNIQHVESQSLYGIAVVKVFLQPDASIDRAIAQITASSQTQLRQLPAGTTPPLVIAYSASSVPVMQLALSGQGLSEQQLNDYGLNFIRTQLITVPGTAVPYPYGGKQRQVQVDLNPAELQSKGLSASDVVNSISAQNLILPTGTSKIGSKEYNVDIPNAAPITIADLNRIPVKTVANTTIYMKDVAWVRDGFPPQTNIVRVNGQRSVLLTIQKAGDASTLKVISGIKSLLPQVAATLPKQLKMKPLADQSVFVLAAISGVVREALIAACLTAVMILIFLGSWRSTLIIATSIPLAVLTSIIVLSLIGQTINIMTLGGLALAVGILVDDATVEVENINRNREAEPDKPLDEVILDSAMQIATPAFVSTLSICIVFAPMFLLSGVARYLFLPLAEAVVFAHAGLLFPVPDNCSDNGEIPAAGTESWRSRFAQP